MFKILYKAIRLELNFMKEKKLSMLFFLLVPSIIVAIFAKISSKAVNWGNYQSLGITTYDLYAPGILPLIILFITVQLTILRIIGERAPYGTLDRDLLAIPRSSMYIGKLIANFVFVFIQIFLLHITIISIFPVRNYGSPLAILLFFILMGLFGLTLGLLISVFARSKEQAIQLTPFIILILFIGILGLISDMGLSPSIERIANNSPLMLVASSLKMSMLDGVGFEDIIGNMYKSLGWIFGLTIIGLIKFRFERKK